MQLLDGFLVESQVLLAADENDGKALAEMQDFGDPLEIRAANQHPFPMYQAREQSSYLLLHIVQRVGRVDRETDENYVGIGV